MLTAQGIRATGNDAMRRPRSRIPKAALLFPVVGQAIHIAGIAATDGIRGGEGTPVEIQGIMAPTGSAKTRNLRRIKRHAPASATNKTDGTK